MERQYAYGLGIDDVLVLFDKNGESYDAYYYLKDPLWTVEALVDEDAAIVEAYAYEVYGKPTIKTGDGGDGDWFDGDETTASASAKGNPYLFTARRWDHDVSLQFNRARWYDPEAARWVSRDPLGYVDGMNLYEYCVSNPTNATDALGKKWALLCYAYCLPAIQVGLYSACVQVCIQAHTWEEVDDWMDDVWEADRRCRDPKSDDDCLACPWYANFQTRCARCCEDLYVRVLKEGAESIGNCYCQGKCQNKWEAGSGSEPREE